MKRFSAAMAVLLASACGGNGTPPAKATIQVFLAQPGLVSLGGTTNLVIAASPADATLTIDNGVGDVTGKTVVAVSPADNTTYTLTAKAGGTTATANTFVGVVAAPSTAFKVEPASAVVVVAGAPATYTITALDAAGAVNTNYRGKVHFTSDDLQAVLPADVTFVAANAGKVSAAVTFKTAGTRALVATDSVLATAQGTARAAVSPAAAASLKLTGLPDAPVAGDRLAITVAAIDAFGNLATGYAGTVHFSSNDATAQVPADYTFGAADKGVHAFGASLTKAAAATLSVASTGVTGSSGSMTVKHAAAARVTLEGVPASVTVDSDVVVTVTVRDAFANPITDYAGTLHFVLTDGSAAAIPDLVFTPAMFGTADVTVRFATASDQSIIASDTASASIAGSTATKVNHGSAKSYVLSTLPTGAVAGEPLPLGITAVDAHGNVVKNYAGTAHVSSTDTTDRLPADGAFTGGLRTVSLAFVTAAAHSATVSEVSGSITANTSSVTVVPGDATAFAVTGGSTTAGDATSTTVTARDTYANTVVAFAGTVTLATSDGQATPPAPHTFNSGDAGAFTFPITLLTAGAQTVTATAGSVSGSGGFTVAPAAGTACVVTDAPATAAAGSQVGLRVVVKDAYSNVATGYTGTIAITSSDTSAQRGADGTFTTTDAGSHAFSVQLHTAGSQTVTATDTVSSALTCFAGVNVVPGATVLAVTFPALNTAQDAWAGTPVSATVTAQDAFANRVSNYGGTVAFTSSDAAAVKPTNATFAPGDNGQKSVNVTFNSVGAQTFTATDTVTAPTQGTSKSASVHGLVYTNPATGGKVRLIQNAVSNASLVQLDLVSNTSLFALTLGTADTVRNGVFAAGLNLPLDTTKVGPDTTLLVNTVPTGSTAVLNLGIGTQAKGAAINTSNGVLYSGISQKRIDTSAGAASNNMRGDVSVRPFPGAGSYYYSLRLKLTSGAAVGTVFDGQALTTKFHAAIRDRSGSDVFSGPDFAIGKLEIR